jgi:dolichyl-phosphate-mannose-protein mannosyltransferase
VWEASRRRRFHLPRPFRRAITIESFGLVLAFLVLPAAIYLVSYLYWFLHFGWHLGAWLTLQRKMFDFQAGLRSPKEPNPFQSGAWQWFLLWRRVLFHAVNGPNLHKVIYANGNPAILWGSILAVPFAAIAWIRRWDWRAGFVVVTVLALWLPWFLSSHPEYLFYAAPITPFLVLSCVYALKAMTEYTVVTEVGKPVRPLLPPGVVFVIIAVGLFAFFWPTLTGGPLSDQAYRLRTWFPSWR